MRLFGRWNSWLPAGVARIFRVEPSPPQPATAPAGGGWPEQGAALVRQYGSGSARLATEDTEQQPVTQRRQLVPTRTETAATDRFPTDTTGLPAWRRSEGIELEDGATFEREIAPVSKQSGDASVRMLAYNGSIPGPTLQVPQNSEIVVNVVNRGDLEATPTPACGWRTATSPSTTRAE